MNLIEPDAVTLRDGIAAGKLSVREVTEAHLDRIDEVNPGLNAIVSLRARADILAEAEAMDQSGPGEDQPLFGLPIAIKDLADTKGLRTTYGSPAFADHVPDTDCLLVARLRAAGCLIIGKTNTPEMGLGSNSYNPVHGITRNPFDQSKTCGGSSGGAAVAVATGMLPFADGSDMMGSLRNPAGWNNIYGFRPSTGLVAKDAAGDSFHKDLSTHGPMGRSPADMDLMLKVIGQPDPQLPGAMAPYRGMAQTNPDGIRIGWAGDWGGAFPMEDGILGLCVDALNVLDDLGCEIIPMVPEFDTNAIWDSWTTLRSWAIAGESAALLDDPATHNLLKPELIWEIERGLSYSAMDITRASTIRADWLRHFSVLDVDILALPTAQLFPFDAELDWPKQIAGQKMDTYHRWMEVVVPASLLGLPVAAVPCGFNADGLPMGLQLIGRHGQDAEVMALTQHYHEATLWPQRHAP